MKYLLPILASLCLLTGCTKTKWIEAKVLDRQDSVEGYSTQYGGATYTVVSLRVKDSRGVIYRVHGDFNMYGFVKPGDTVACEIDDNE